MPISHDRLEVTQFLFVNFLEVARSSAAQQLKEATADAADLLTV